MKWWNGVLVPIVVLALMQGNAAYGAFDPLQDPALIGWWKCDEGQGNVVADASAAHHDGTFVDGNPAWVPGAVGNAIDLIDPTLVEVPPMGLTLTEATIIGWVLPHGPQVRWASIIMHRGPGPAHGFNLTETRQLAYHWNGLATTYNFRGNAYYVNDEWTHCALTIEPTKATFYVNGVEAAVNAIAHTAATWDGRVWFGGDRTYTGTRHIKGALDEILFFRRALTAAEIKSLVPPKLKATKPSPADGATNITMPLLQWTAGEMAVFHNVYLGTTPQLTEAHLVGKSQPFAMLYYLQGFAPGTTYYWRVDEITAAGVVTTGDVWRFTTAAVTATQPVPPDGAAYVTTSATLSWTAGQNAVMHDVYVGANRADVESGAAGAFKGKQATTSLQLDGLARGTTYYWRVDEVAVNGSKVAGPVWSFTTRPVIAKPDPDFVGWWKLENEGSGAAIDYSGNDRDGILMGGPQWVDGYLGGALKVDGVDDYVETNYAQDLAKWTVCTWVMSPAAPAATAATGPVHREKNFQINWNHGTAADRGAAGLRVGGTWSFASFGTLSANTWYHLAASFDGTTLKAYTNGVLITTTPVSGVPDAEVGTLKFGRHSTTATNFFAGTIDDVRVYGRALTDEEIKKAMQGDPLLASNPQPAHGVSVDIQNVADLAWTAGEGAAQHDVYFGKDLAAVKAASPTSPEYKGRQAGTSFSLAGLVEIGGGSYFWRIDEVAADGTIHKGSVWTFTIPGYLIVDEFESYTDDEGNRIYETWEDGWVNGTGSVVGNLQAPFAERTVIHGGKQAMPMDYNNAKTPFYSEASQTFAPVRNWTDYGVTDLSLWFRGNPVRFVDKGNGAFTVGASGHDIWDNADDFRFVWKRLAGDGSIVVKVESIGNTNGWAKAGVMIRENLTAGSTMAYMIQSVASGVSFGWRQIADGTCGSSTQAGIMAPQWVKLTRKGNAFTAQYSADDKTWTDVKDATSGQPVSTTILMGASIYIGLCTTSHNATATTTAQYSGAATTGGVTGAWQETWIGDDRDLTNGAASLYLVVEDSAGKSVVVTHPDPAAVNVAAWTEWKVPLSSLTGVNLARVKMLYLGVGDRKNPVPDGTGRIYIDDIRVGK
jgi:hypothetical protein